MTTPLASQTPKRQFKNYFIHSKFQTGVLVRLLLMALVVVVVNFQVFRVVSEEAIRIVDGYVHLDPAVRLSLNQEFAWIGMLIVGLSALITLIFCGATIIVSHRAAGPMYRFRKVFEAIDSASSQERIRLRAKDDFQDVAEAFNLMMDRIGKR